MGKIATGITGRDNCAQILEAALDYAEAGIPVFPCGPNKRPLTDTGFKEATTELQQVRTWWTAYPQSLIGRPTGAASGVVVLDVDIDETEGKDGEAALSALVAKYGPLPDTWEAMTPRGGRHIYFRHPGRPIPCSASKIGKDLDVRGDGGYVITPPSTLPDGRCYQWEGSSDPEEGAPLAEMPRWLLELVEKPPERQSAQPTAGTNPTVKAGSRNDSLYRLACSMRAKGLSEAALVAALQAENAERCDPPLSPDEVAKIAASAGTKPQGRMEIDAKPEADSVEPPPIAHLRFSLEDLSAARLTPPCLVEKYLYADVAVLAAAGGTGKTTLAIYEAIHIALGRPLYGLKVANPGSVLFITAEDRRETFAARLRHLMEALDLDDAERGRVLERVFVWDVTGSDLRLACVVDNMIVLTGLADRIVEAYRDNPPALIVFDPLVSFGADEGRFNANEQAIITASRRIVAGLGCCVRLIAHTGKGNARDGALDQYGFRGGSALADGSRMMTILQTWNPGQSTTAPSPPATLATSAKSSITILSRAKLSYCESQPLLWISRAGWNFESAVDVTTTPEEAAKGREEQILTFLADQLKNGRRHSASTLEECAPTLGMTRAQVRAALSELVNLSRQLVHVELPKDQQQGRRKTFLCPANSAEARGEIEAKKAALDGGIPPPPIIPPPIGNEHGGIIDPPYSIPIPSIPQNVSAEYGGIGGIAQTDPPTATADEVDGLPEWVEEDF